MKKMLVKKFKDMGFQYKILLISLFVSLVPVTLLGAFSYHQMRNLLIEREMTALKETLNQEILSLDYKLNAYLTATNLIVWNDSMRSALSQEYNNVYDMYLVYRDIIDPTFLTIYTMHEAIRSITIYSDGSLYPHGNILRPLSDMEQQEWYPHVEIGTSPVCYLNPDGQTLYIVRKMYYQYASYTNIVCMSIDASNIFYTLTTLYDSSYGVILTDENYKPLLEHNEFSDSQKQYMLSAEELMEEIGQSSMNDYVLEMRTLTSVPWNVYLYRPVKTISASAADITILVLGIIFLSVIIILLASFLLSKMIVRPIKNLAENMRQIEQDNLEITVSSDSFDEIGQLIKTFSHMVQRLKYLINEVLQSRIMQQEYEMKVLQAQINPHFLYNSLAVINNKAIVYGHDDISRMARLLSAFYRTTLNKGKNITSVKDELENVRSYIDIQRMMHSNSFDVCYYIDHSILDYNIPNLLIQPLVENAILHGLDHKTTPGIGVLTLNAYREENDLIFKITDNGCGIREADCTELFNKENSGYGLKNIHQRIQLYCGTSYGVTCSSTFGMGTLFTVRIAIK